MKKAATLLCAYLIPGVFYITSAISNDIINQKEVQSAQNIEGTEKQFIQKNKSIEETHKENVPNKTPEKQIVKLLSDLKKKNELFSVKLISPLMPRKIQIWKQKNIINLPVSWNQFVNGVQQVGNYVSQFLEKDNRSGKYFYIEDLQKNIDIYTNLKSITQGLNQFLPLIGTESVFKLSKLSLTGLQRLITIYSTELYANKLLEKIKNLLEQYKKQKETKETSERANIGFGEYKDNEELDARLFGDPYAGFDYDVSVDFDDLLEEDLDLGDLEDINLEDLDFSASFFD